MARDILAAGAAGVACERCFSIARRHYGSQKHYSPTTFRALMMVLHAENQQNQIEWAGLDLEGDLSMSQEEKKVDSDMRETQATDDHVIYISDDDETRGNNIVRKLYPLKILLTSCEQQRAERRSYSQRGSTSIDPNTPKRLKDSNEAQLSNRIRAEGLGALSKFAREENRNEDIR